MYLKKTKLFLLKANFSDPNLGDENLRYFCPDCAIIEGILSYYPNLKNELDIQYVDFQRPRNELVALLGVNNQSCPSLIINFEKATDKTLRQFQQYSDYLFSNDPKIIANYFAEKFGIGIEHP